MTALMGQLNGCCMAQLGNIIVINTCGFMNYQKAESVNMILEYADKRRFSRQRFL
jgi:ribosomal protein S12 methylthiotransferase